MATVLSWRYSFGILTLLSIIVLFLSFRLKPVPRQAGIKIDFIGALLVAVAIVLISLGFNNINAWGLVLARSGAPFSVLGLSPAPFMIVIGIVFGQAFFTWSHGRQANHQNPKTPLLPLELLDSSHERAATYTLFIISALGPAVNFLIPLYLQIAQGSTSLQTAVATVPYTLAIFLAAVFVVRLYDRLSPRQIGSFAFGMTSVGLALLAFVIQNDWGVPMVILSLIILGLGEGALVTLLFNVLVTESPKELAGAVGALRGTVNNLSTAVGTAVAGLLAVSLLSLVITSRVTDNPNFPPNLLVQVNFDDINFVSNDRLEEVLSNTTATPEQVSEAVQINEEARLQALKDALLILAAIALLAILPARDLPKYTPEEVQV